MSHRPTIAPHRRLAILVALCFTATSAAALAVPANTFAWGDNAYSSSSEKELIALTNQSRAAAGRKALKVSSTLTSIARWRSKDMIKRDYFSHSIPGVGKVFDVMDDKGYCYHLAGENIGWNNEAEDVATARIHALFMDSSSHRSNILGKSWDVIGIGAYQGTDGKKMWTVLFADRAGCSTTPASTPKPTAKPKPKPTPAATTRPTKAPTPSAAPVASETPSIEPTPDPTSIDEPISFPPPEPFPSDDPDGTREPSGDPGDGVDDPPSDEDAVDHGLRVLEPPDPPGLLDTIVGGVTGFFFGG
jgi:uncharacterized protein YkwD